MSLKIYPILAILLIAGIFILVVALIRGCNQSKLQLSNLKKSDSLNKELLHTIASDRISTDSTKKQYKDSLEFITGQYALAKEQALRSDVNLQAQINVNNALIAKHKWDKYADTSAVLTPHEFIEDCEGCFTNLEKTTGLVERYKTDINNLQNSWDKQSQLYQKRFKELDAEKLGFYNKINTLAKAQQEAIDKLKPHGQLYFSWGGVVWPVAPNGRHWICISNKI